MCLVFKHSAPTLLTVYYPSCPLCIRTYCLQTNLLGSSIIESKHFNQIHCHSSHLHTPHNLTIQCQGLFPPPAIRIVHITIKCWCWQLTHICCGRILKLRLWYWNQDEKKDCLLNFGREPHIWNNDTNVRSSVGWNTYHGLTYLSTSSIAVQPSLFQCFRLLQTIPNEECELQTYILTSSTVLISFLKKPI